MNRLTLGKNVHLKATTALILITAVISFAMGTIVFLISPEGFPLTYQHIFEITGIMIAGIMAYIITEDLYGDLYDDKEVVLFLGLLTALSLIFVPLVQLLGLTPFPAPVEAGLMAAIEATAAVRLTALLETYTEII